MAFDVEVVRTRDLAVLRCRGRLVLGHGAHLLRHVAARELSTWQTVALDLGSVTQMDARGTGVVAELCRIARDGGRVLMLAGVSERVRRLLRLTRLDTRLPALKSALAGEFLSSPGSTATTPA